MLENILTRTLARQDFEDEVTHMEAILLGNLSKKPDVRKDAESCRNEDVSACLYVSIHALDTGER